MRMRWIQIPVVAAAVAGCGGTGGDEDGLSGTVAIDGSSTVYPITEAVAEEFRTEAPGVRVTVGVSGTGGGFERFGTGETDISDASRYIKESEIETCAEHGIEFIELPIAFDGIAIVVNPDNEFATDITADELRAMWAADATSRTWADIREGWPDRPFQLFAPGQDSGTFDYFTEAINGESGNCRADCTFSEDDNVLVRGVAGESDGIGFFGYAYYVENQDKLRAVPVDDGGGPVMPSMETIAEGTYTPLSRPIFIYVGAEAAQRPEVDAFVDFYLDEAGTLSAEVGYVPLPDDLMARVREVYDARRTGTRIISLGS